MACKYKSRVWDDGWCNVACRYCTLKQESGCKYNKQTNADRIRAMSDEELAEYLHKDPVKMFCNSKIEHNESCSEFGCKDCLLEWLQQPAEGE